MLHDSLPLLLRAALWQWPKKCSPRWDTLHTDRAVGVTLADPFLLESVYTSWPTPDSAVPRIISFKEGLVVPWVVATWHRQIVSDHLADESGGPPSARRAAAVECKNQRAPNQVGFPASVELCRPTILGAGPLDAFGILQLVFG